MAKLILKNKPLQGGEGKRYLFFCPGCECAHSFDVRTDGGHPSWSFNGDLERPTFTPSLHCPQSPVCHLFLTDGKLQFLADCQHKLAGQTVDLPDWED